jgi:hypothetical protein
MAIVIWHGIISNPKSPFQIKPRTWIRAQERAKKLQRKLDAYKFRQMGIAEGLTNPTKSFRPNPLVEQYK